MKRRKFTNEFKTKTVLTILENKETILDISRRLECHPQLLHRWKDEFLAKAHLAFSGGSKEEKEQQKKIEKYEKVITKMTTQNDFLERVLSSLE